MTVDPSRPSAARVYDCFLGGRHNFAVDREIAERAVELVPEIPRIMRANRDFLRRAVCFAAARGVHQFLDIGSGIPTEGNVHEVARSADPAARVVYVDLDPTAVVHARQLLGDDQQTLVLQADLQQADRILAGAAALLDLGRPVCLLLIAMLHFIPDSPDLREALRRYHAALAPGSLLVVSHGTPSARPEALRSLADLYIRTGTPMVLRDPDELRDLLQGWTLLPPGLVFTPQWRPAPGTPPVADPAASITLAAVAERT